MDAEAKAAGIPILNELGLDPGIDHLSAMEVIDGLRAEGKTLTGFESYTGGLVAPESDDNPWHYKFTESAQRVVLAGQGGSATFKENGRIRVLPPHRLFQEITAVDVPGAGRFEGYANRDSLCEEIYGIQGIDTLVRTLRGEGFCGGWDAVFQLGMNRDDAQVALSGRHHLARLHGWILRRGASRSGCRSGLRGGGPGDRGRRSRPRLAGQLGLVGDAPPTKGVGQSGRHPASPGRSAGRCSRVTSTQS